MDGPDGDPMKRIYLAAGRDGGWANTFAPGRPSFGPRPPHGARRPLSLLALVRHMAEVERTWFRRVINGEDIPLVWSPDGDFQVAYDASRASAAEAFAAWREEMEHSRRIERAATSLDVTGYQPRWEMDVSLRLVMLHMIHEYARHNGHADFLREAVDGTTGV